MPCLRPLPPGWTFASANVRNGWSQLTLNHDRVGTRALVIRLTATCDPGSAIQRPANQPGARRYERPQPGRSEPGTTWYTLFPGGCVTTQFHPASSTHAGFADEVNSALGFTSRHGLDQTLEARSNGRLHLDPLPTFPAR